ncbi:MAG: 30S ribosomal protein S17 [Thermodesulfobacteriota bacterium]
MGDASVKTRKTLIGNVLKSKMDKTAVVSVERLKKHPLYGKYIKRRVKYMVHDEKNDCKAGDRVQIIETRNLSKLKTWRVGEILEKAK